ncbi:MAG: tRNA 4-thiouridine(8) synthase ThiI [Nitrospirae bacterium RIFCSPLOWO2_02_FULL_62_14]|nr:MAG: tRNA 4-thiouridine(8) synthase ThiI [Nitrospirae bacterium RIFCSPLOWO2_02_FULL_62_14]
MRCAIVHYHELALKGRNRPFFEGKLVRHIRTALKGLGIARVEPLQGRIRVVLKDEARWEPVKERLTRVFGIANFSLNHAVPLDLNKPNLEFLKSAAGEVIRDIPFSTFRVSTRRADKRFPLTSMDVDRAIGAHIVALTGKKVDLSHPDLTIHIEMMARQSYVAAGKEQGPGGMPTGVSGKVACLLSGGIDSPVASYRMLKRGCKATFVHFHGRPFVTRASEEKVREIAELLTRYQLYSRLYLVPFGEIQRQIVLGAPAPFRVVLYRRMMVRIAEELARRDKCWALVTGDSLGQVASQTPENLGVVEDAAHLPLLRPLIGMDKLEITEQAQQIGTFETSIEPDQDCCKLFVPAHPSTRTSLDYIRKVERGLDIDTLVKQGLDKTELAEFTYP